MNNPDHISERIETIFLVKILKFFDADPAGIFYPGAGIRDGKNSDPTPQHWLVLTNAKSGYVCSMEIYISKFLVGRSWKFAKIGLLKHFSECSSGVMQ
jgi:hypothetical protein